MRTRNSKLESRNSAKRSRARIDYVNESLRDGIKILRLIIAAPTRGYTFKDLERASGLNYDFCRRACFTLEHLGLARQTTSGTWKPGDVRAALGSAAGSAGILPASSAQRETGLFPTPDVAALADSMR